ncbi:hypothetical protein AB0F71_13560 [Kitasatospora sp. NPDC028055]|uniref:hypothetical protein n=1 Tax=Kitasatospora sp. NPDC028055 TaxID=3155653 RepID=UPI0033C601BD
MPVRPRRAAAAAALAAALLLSLSPFPAAAARAAQPAVTYSLRNARTGTCLHHVPGTAQVRLEPCEAAAPGQRWELRAVGAAVNVAAFDPEQGAWGCVAIGDNWSIRYGQCRATESAWSVADGGRCRVRSESDLNDNDLYLTQTQEGGLGARPGGAGPAADWTVTADAPAGA